MAKSDLTVEQVAELLEYGPETGQFIWKRRRGNAQWTSANAGRVAGSTNSKGYVVIYINGTPYYAHRLAWLIMHKSWPIGEIDHSNLLRSDNRIANLREASRLQQRLNQPRPKNNSSGFKGVCWSKKCGKWQAYFRRKHLGLFSSREEAHGAYQRAAAAADPVFARAM